MAEFSNDAVIKEFRENGGKVGGYFEGMPLLLLTYHRCKERPRRT